MNDTPHEVLEAHAPDPAFRDYLESEVVLAYRRGRTLRRLRYAAVILVSVAIGMTTSMASAQVRNRVQRDSILEAAQSDATLARARLRIAQTQFTDAKRAYDIGARSKESLLAAGAQVLEAEVDNLRVALNTSEIQATSLPPRDDLNAPLVNGRDFVTERLHLQLRVAQKRVELGDEAKSDAARRVRVGAASEITELEAALALRKAVGTMMVLTTRTAARKEFLDKQTPIAEIDRKVERASVTADLTTASVALDLASRRLALLRKQKDVGMTEEIEVLRAELEIKERQLEMQRLSCAIGGASPQLTRQSIDACDLDPIARDI